jgi:hypothetical protein
MGKREEFDGANWAVILIFPCTRAMAIQDSRAHAFAPPQPTNGEKSRTGRDRPTAAFCITGGCIQPWSKQPITRTLHPVGVDGPNAGNQSAPKVHM